MQAKLDEEAGQLVQLRQNIEQEWAGRALAGEARHQAQDVQRRITDDARARLPPASSGVGQNLAVATILLRAMPEPSTTEGGVSRENSRISWRMQRSDGPRALPPEGKGTPRSIAPRLPDSCGKPRSTPGARGTRHLRPRVASATSTAATTVEPASRKGAPRLPPQAWGTLRQWGGSEPLARTTWSASLQPGHTTGTVPDPVPSPDYHHQVLGGNKAGTVACGLPSGLPARWNE
jgi:hypothetical protein